MDIQASSNTCVRFVYVYVELSCPNTVTCTASPDNQIIRRIKHMRASQAISLSGSFPSNNFRIEIIEPDFSMKELHP